MKNINLLTEKYISRIILRQSIRQMTAAPAVIFLSLILIVIVLSLTICVFQGKLERNSVALQDEKYKESDRIAKELQSRSVEISEAEEIQKFISSSNMHLSYWAVISEESGDIEAEYLKMDSAKGKITIRFITNKIADAAEFAKRLEQHSTFSKIDFIEMDAKGESKIFVMELHTRTGGEDD